MNKQIDYIKDAVEILGDNALVISMEECAELQQAVSKHIRGNAEDKKNTTEEIADVLICIEWIKERLDISEAEIQGWVDYKKKRIEREIESGTLN